MAAPTPPRPRTIAALDVPLEALTADVARLAEQRAIEGALAEQDHQYRDLDPDSTCCPDGFACPACPPNEGSAA